MATASSKDSTKVIRVDCPKCGHYWGDAVLVEPIVNPSRARFQPGFTAIHAEPGGVARWTCPVDGCPGKRPWFSIGKDQWIVGLWDATDIDKH